MMIATVGSAGKSRFSNSERGSVVQTKGTSDLQEPLRSNIERLSGVSMEGVKIHRNSKEPDAFGAYAFTRGKDIFLARGQEKNLAHEAWHVAQQAKGRVQATTEVNGVGLNESTALEREADVKGQEVSRMLPKINPSTREPTTKLVGTGLDVMQRMAWEGRRPLGQTVENKPDEGHKKNYIYPFYHAQIIFDRVRPDLPDVTKVGDAQKNNIGYRSMGGICGAEGELFMEKYEDLGYRKKRVISRSEKQDKELVSAIHQYRHFGKYNVFRHNCQNWVEKVVEETSSALGWGEHALPGTEVYPYFG